MNIQEKKLLPLLSDQQENKMIKLIITITTTQEGRAIKVNQKSENEDETPPEVLLANFIIGSVDRVIKDALRKDKEK